MAHMGMIHRDHVGARVGASCALGYWGIRAVIPFVGRLQWGLGIRGLGLGF